MAGFGSQTLTLGANASWCECVVPSKASFRCSFNYVNGDQVTVVPAQ